MALFILNKYINLVSIIIFYFKRIHNLFLLLFTFLYFENCIYILYCKILLLLKFQFTYLCFKKSCLLNFPISYVNSTYLTVFNLNLSQRICY